MKERIEAIGGRFSVEANAGSGVLITMEYPDESTQAVEAG